MDIVYDGGTTTAFVIQRFNGGLWISLGTFNFDGVGDSVLIRTDGTNGYVVADAVRFVRLP